MFLFCNTIAKIMKRERIVVIGAGPAGIACSMQLARSGLEPFLIERDRAGGLLRQAHLVENYPGFPLGITGEALVRQFVLQLERFAIPVHTRHVTSLERQDDHFYLKTDQEELEARTVVVASGTQPKLLDPSHMQMNGTINYDIRPLLPLRGMSIAIIGGGDAAFDYALALAEGNEMSILFRKAEPSCLPVLHDRVREKASIRLYANCVVQAIHRKEKKLFVDCEKMRETGFDHILFAIGRVPSVAFLSTSLLRAFQHGKQSSNLYFIGDVGRGNTRQVAIAVGDGMQAAMEINQRTKSMGHRA